MEIFDSCVLDLVETVENLKNNLTLILTQNKQLKKKLSILTDDLNQVQDQQYTSEVKFIELCQYSRRENVELHNVPESIEQKNLEKHVLAVLALMGIHIQSYDIVEVHRIRKKIYSKNRKVLVRFVNRKNAFTSLKYGRKLRSCNQTYKNYFITENLCPENHNIFNRCYKLKKLGVINNVWTYNGVVYIKFSENDDGISIQHFDDIEYYTEKRNNIISD